MGAWNYQVFCDDMSCDAMYDIMDSENLFETLQEFLDEAIGLEDDYLESDVAGYALAAAATIDSVINGPAWDILTDMENVEDTEYAGFFKNNEEHKEELKGLCKKAVKALGIILGEESELRELWEENEELYPSWKSGILKLKERLSMQK